MLGTIPNAVIGKTRLMVFTIPANPSMAKKDSSREENKKRITYMMDAIDILKILIVEQSISFISFS